MSCCVSASVWRPSVHSQRASHKGEMERIAWKQVDMMAVVACWPVSTINFDDSQYCVILFLSMAFHSARYFMCSCHSLAAFCSLMVVAVAVVMVVVMVVVIVWRRLFFLCSIDLSHWALWCWAFSSKQLPLLLHYKLLEVLNLFREKFACSRICNGYTCTR